MQEYEMKRKMKEAGKRVGLISLVVGLLFIFIILNPFVKINAGERGVLLNFGAVSPNVLDEGLHIMIPIMQKAARIDVKIQK
ncbi:MAG: SPFH domain-containing protein, partial [Candidatus Deferrimicrobiaceae bacterium]